jgi:hypothetical protein
MRETRDAVYGSRDHVPMWTKLAAAKTSFSLPVKGMT